MLKKDISYEDIDGNPVTETFYFNISKMELAELELLHRDPNDESETSSYADHLRAMLTNKDPKVLLTTFKDFIARAYGERSEDGKRFLKSPERSAAFAETDAFGALFFELISDAMSMAAFFTGVMPADIREKAADAFAESNQLSVIEPAKKTPEDYTEEELVRMSDEDFNRIVGRNPRRMSQRSLQIAFLRKTNK